MNYTEYKLDLTFNICSEDISLIKFSFERYIKILELKLMKDNEVQSPEVSGFVVKNNYLNHYETFSALDALDYPEYLQTDIQIAPEKRIWGRFIIIIDQGFPNIFSSRHTNRFSIWSRCPSR